MSQQLPNSITIDLDQWKRDVATFAETTLAALEGIGGELSNQVSQPAMELDDSTKIHSPATRTESVPTPGQPQSREPANGNDRLAKLKSALAARVSQH